MISPSHRTVAGPVTFKLPIATHPSPRPSLSPLNQRPGDMRVVHLSHSGTFRDLRLGPMPSSKLLYLVLTRT